MITQPSLFDPQPSQGYSYQTSLPAYHENKEGKDIQAQKIYAHILRLRETCIRQLAELTHLPDSTVSARLSDLREAGKVKWKVVDDKLELIHYKGRMRKKIILA